MNNLETDTDSEEIQYNNMNSINDLSTDSEDNNSTIQNTINGGENDIEIMKKLVNMCVKYENDLIKTQTKLIWLQSMRIVFENIFNIIGIDYHETM